MPKTHLSNIDYEIYANTIALVCQNGNFQIENTADKGAMTLSSLGVIQIGVPSVSLVAANYTQGGTFSITAGGLSPQIQISTVSDGSTSDISLNSDGIEIGLLMAGEGPSTLLSFGPAMLTALVSEGGAFSKLVMLPDQISMEVGTTLLNITDEGLTITSGDTVFSVTPEGISEVSGDSTRALNSEGHNLTASETELNISPSGVEIESASLSIEVEGTNELNASVSNYSFDATCEIESAITTIE